MKTTFTRSTHTWFLAVPAVVFCAIGGPLPRAHAQDDFRYPLNFAYATWIGSGYYKVGDRDALIFRMSLASVTLREATEEQFGLSLLTPLTLGFFDFGDFNESLGAAAFVPGLQVDIPITRNWRLKPFGQLGYGKEFKGGDGAWIYGGGIRSLAVFPWRDFEFGLGNTLMFAGQEYSGERYDSGFSMFEIGLNVGYPPSFEIFGKETRINTFFVYTAFIDDVDIIYPGGKREQLNELYQFGANLEPDTGFDIWFVNLRSLGLTYAFGDDAWAIRVNTGFPF